MWYDFDWKKEEVKQQEVRGQEIIYMDETYNDHAWNEKYEIAKQYYLKHGNLLIPQKYEINGIKIGLWISTQRQNYKKGKLSSERLEKLKLINFFKEENNTIKLDNSWLEKYELAKQYYLKYGDLLIPQNYVINGIRLGAWINNQRNLYKAGKLSKERIEMLEHIGMVWTTYKKNRYDEIESLKQLRETLITTYKNNQKNKRI